MATVLVGCSAACSEGDGEPARSYELAEVVDVVDGDTFTAVVDGAEERIRIVGVDAPEQGECYADQATDALGRRIFGRTIRLQRDESERDQYDRLLRLVNDGDERNGGVDVGGYLVLNGFARARSVDPDIKNAAAYERDETQARDAKRGLWAPDACGAPVLEGQLTIVEIVGDAPGDDAANLNGETVAIRNTGRAPADLTGWVLRDDSSTHRYSFPAGFVLPTGAQVVVHSGCGEDRVVDLYWCVSGSAIWNNDGDTATLLDPKGNIAAELAYTP